MHLTNVLQRRTAAMWENNERKQIFAEAETGSKKRNTEPCGRAAMRARWGLGRGK